MGASLPKILGTASVNEKGQIVIPAEARNTLGLKPGSRVVIMSSSRAPGLTILRAEDVETMIKGFTDALNRNNTKPKK